MKNPVVLAIFVAAIVFAAMYYYYNYYGKNEKCDKDTNDKKSTNKKSKKKEKKKGTIINEIMVISAAVAGLVTWYIVNTYFPQDNISDTDEQKTLESDHEFNINEPIVQTMKGSGTIKTNNKMSKIPRLDEEDSTRSYNLIGSGVNIPRTDLKIPSVLIDYK